MSNADLTYATAGQLARALAAKALSAVELTESAIARIEALDDRIHAVCVRDFERAREDARAADAARARGDSRPLLGIPMLVKESFNVAGLPTTWGIPPFKDFVASEDAVAVARMKSAGAVVLGKTNVPLGLGDLQTYNAIYGTTHNPWDLTKTPGGSSGGSAAALAAGYAPLSLGSDIAGSLRVPAHFCGIYAHKPSHGVVPSRGHVPPPAKPIPLDRDLSVVGPMARSAGDLALQFQLLADPDEMAFGKGYRLALPPARHQALKDYRVLVLETHPAIGTAQSVGSAIADAVRVLEGAGAKVERTSALLPDLLEGARIYMRLLLSAIAASYPPELYRQLGEQALGLPADDRSLAAERLRGSVLSHRDWVATDTARAALRHRWRALFTEFDIVLCPVSPTPAFAHDQSPNPWVRRISIDGVEYDYADQLVWSGLASAPGLPSTALPIGRGLDQLPVGIQLVGPMYEDLTTLQFAQLLENELGGFVAPGGLSPT